METVDVWYLTDNDAGKGVGASLQSMGLLTTLLSCDTPKMGAFDIGTVNLFIFDFINIPGAKVLEAIRSDERFAPFLKIIIVPFETVDEVTVASRDLQHIDFLSRPYNKRELLLLLEKSAVVEKYREIMRSLSRDAAGRIQAFEHLMSIHKNDVLENESDKEIFDRIVVFERRLLDEQKKLNESIRQFAAMRQKEVFDIRHRLQAEEQLDALRRSEMLDANETIRAQQAVLDFSARQVEEANKILQAVEITHELSREEALALHQALSSAKDRICQLETENAELKKKAGAQ
jgi:hypothetical protein